MKQEMEPLIGIEGVYGVIAASLDGIIIDSLTRKDVDEETFAALTAKISKEVADKTGIKKNVLTIIKGKNGYLIFMTKKDLVMGVVAGNEVNVGATKREIKKVAEKIQGLIGG